jgi:arsenite methyltransferase
MSNDARRSIVSFYEGDAWGDSIHPGGMELTARIASLVGIEKDCTVLDVASGKGETALYLAQTYGCAVLGIDVSRKLVDRARQRASGSRVDNLPAFVVADAEVLPFCDGCFDVLLCECSFSLLSSKDTATKEFCRVLRRDGRIGIADFYLRTGYSSFKSKPPYLCPERAETQETYQAILVNSGFREIRFEDQTDKLKETFLDLMLNFGSINAFIDRLPQSCSTECGTAACAEITEALKGGVIGYCIATGIK